MADPRNMELIRPYKGDPFLGNLETPINSSDFSKAFIGNLPAYRRGLSPLVRGLEIGLAHGYFLVGPWTVLGPLRDYEKAANLGGLISALTLVLIATVCMSVYGLVTYGDDDEPVAKKDSLQTAEGWSQLVAGFFIGGMGGAFVAYFLLENFSSVDAIFRGIVHG